MERKLEREETSKVKKLSEDNVDYTFWYRYKVNELLDQLIENKRNYKKRDRIIKKILEMEKYAAPVILERVKNAEANEASVLSQLLMLVEFEDEKIGEELIKIAFDPSISDRNKNYILKVLEYYGLEPGELPQSQVFNDPEKAFEDARKALFEEMIQNIESIPQFLLEVSDFPSQAQSNLVSEMVKLGDDRVVILLKIFSQLDEPELVEEAIKGLGSIATPRSLGALEDLLNMNDRQKYYSMIKEEIYNLKEKGVLNPEGLVEDEDFQVGELYQAAVSKIDGRGNRAIWLAFRWGEERGGVCLINFLCNINEGLKDCWGIYRVTIKEFKRIMADFRMDNSLIGNDPYYARVLLKDAINKSNENGAKKPMEFAFWRNFLDKDWTEGEPYNPELEKYYNIFASSGKNVNWKEIEEVYHHRDFWDWFIHHPYVYELASELLYASKKHKKLVFLSTPEQAEDVYVRFVDNLIKPRFDFYYQTLRMMADFELRKGRSRVFRVIMEALYQLDEENIENHPLIKGIVNKSLEMAFQNLRYGYDLRISPEDFDL